MRFARRTLARETTMKGFGLHGGEPVTVRILPSQEGIWFRRGSSRVAARPENVTDTNRCTRLGPFGTIEHIMSALAGLEITDAEIEIDADEMPALDGSATPYVVALREAGFQDFAEEELASLFTRVFVKEPGYEIAIASGQGHWRYDFQSEGRWPYEQSFETSDVVADYAEQIAPARTFGFEHELPAIRAAGLAKGLDLEKALVIGSEGYANAARFPDELARHKLLDAIGDLYLSGVPIRFLNVVCERTGHRMNVEAAARLRAFLTTE